jgi:hypothetical protein
LEIRHHAAANKGELLLAFSVPAAFVLLWQFDRFLTVLFFCFASIYGMMSIDYKQINR